MKKFSESSEHKPELQPKVKHIIEYLSTLDPEADVILDHDGWYIHGYEATDEVDLIKNRGIFDIRSYEGKPILIINN